MKFSSLTRRISGESVEAWSVHYEALDRLNAGEDIILLSVGQESDEHTPGSIVEEAVAGLRNGRHHYTPVEGIMPLRQAIARRHRELTGQQADARNCAVFAGAQNALFAVSQCLLEHGDEVILIEPYYTTYPATVSCGGASIVAIPTRSDNGFRLVPEEIIAAMTPRTRAVLINSPNNPVGTVYTPEQLEPLVNACVERNVWLVHDAVYQELLPPGDRASPAGLRGADKVCITVSSLSKSHRMTGWRVGWVVGPDELIANLYNLSMCMIYGLPAFIMDAAVTAFGTGNATADTVRDTMNRRRAVVENCLTDVPRLRVFSTPGSMYLLLDIGGIGVGSQRFARIMLDRYRVSLLPCDGFGSTCRNFVRISLCAPAVRLRQACDRLVRCCADLVSDTA